MGEDLDERGEPAQEHPWGIPYGNSAYNNKKYRCRCEWCKKAKANDYQRAKGLPQKFAIPTAPGVPPKRPPAMVWLDSSDYTHVVRCERCDKNYGVWLDKWEAQRFQEAHRYMHDKALEPAMDWSKWSEERLLKNPGGRPPLEDKPLCTLEDCSEDAHGKGLCMKHYQQARREGLS